MAQRVEQTQSNASPRWLSFEQLAQLTNGHSVFAQPLAAIGRHFAMSETSVQVVLDLAVDLAELVGARVLNGDQDDSASGAQILDYRLSDAERVQLSHLTMNLEALWRRCPPLARNGVRLMIERTNRHHREVALDQADQLSTLCRFLEGVDVSEGEVQIVLRRRDSSAAVPVWALEPLGIYRGASVVVRTPDTASSDAALERWISVRLVDRKGHGIPNVVSRALFAARVNLEVDTASG